MSFYSLVPSPDLSTKEQNFINWENAFTESELKDVQILCDSLKTQADVGWIEYNQESKALYDKLGYIGRQINGGFFEFDLFGFVEDFQYTVHKEGVGNYDWHIDKGNLNSSPRKLTMIIQLSDPSEYEGGELEFLITDKPNVAQKAKGMIYTFPSWVLHRVTPVTSGIRKSIVVFLSGPKFK